MTVLLFFAVLFVLILVHEWGHYIAAKKTDMRVDEFGIGFPPKLYGFKKGETEWTFNALPIGGFVRIAGENAEDAHEGGDYKRSFVAKSKWAQAIVLVAGVTMNVLFAWVLFAAIFMIGVPTPVTLKEASDQAELVVTHVLPDSPAAEAGLVPGAVITEAARGQDIAVTLTPTTFRDFTTATITPMTVTYLLGEEEVTADLQPRTGIVESNPEQQAIGVSLELIDTVTMGPIAAIVEATKTTVRMLGAIVVGLGTLLAQSVQGTADFTQVAGPIGIAGMVGDAAEFGLTSLLWFTAIISLNLAVINLLPFPALDGGRLVMVGIEAATRRPINPSWVARINLLGFILLLALMVAVTYSDILKLL